MPAPAQTSQLDTSAQVTLLWGDAQILTDRAIERILAASAEAEQAGTGPTILEGSEVQKDEILAELSGLSLLAPQRLVLIKRVHAMAEEAQHALAQALERLPDGVRVIMTAGEGKGPWQARRPPVVADLRKAAEQAGQVLDLSGPQQRDLPQWAVREAERLGKQISQEATQRLVELTGGTVDRIIAELDKIALYIGEAEVIDETAVEAVTSVSEEATVFELVDAIGQRDVPTALRALDLLLPTGTPRGAAIPLLGMIARQLRLIWQARVAARSGARLDRGQQVSEEISAQFPEQHNILSTLKGRDFLARKYTSQARNFTDAQLARALVKVYETDLTIKGQTAEQVDDRLALEMLIVELCQL